MAKGLVIYYSKTGNTKQMAEIISESMNASGLPTDCKPVDKVKVADLLAVDAIVIGSPTYYGQMAPPLMQLFTDSVSRHGSLTGKVGAAFSSSANIGGGNETTIMGILEAMLIHGMIIQGDAQGDHYGSVSIGRPDERVTGQCQKLGQKVAQLTNKLFG
ncbi:MAG: NAD(P)H-dependent oxidoreductase [Sedimentisphaerales bacterium]|nr:NAD(P)H-dependent oxidoreductase [Sedimentisphaerales bacterium]